MISRHLQLNRYVTDEQRSRRRPFDDCEAEQLLIEGERPREIGDDDINVMERKLVMGDDNNAADGDSNAPLPLGRVIRRVADEMENLRTRIGFVGTLA